MTARILRPTRTAPGFPRLPAKPGGIPPFGCAMLALAGLAWAEPDAILSDPANVDSADPLVPSEWESSAENLRIGFYVDAWDRTERRQIHAMLDSWAPGFTTPQFRKCEFQVFEEEQALSAALRLGKLDAVCLYAFQMPALGQSMRLEPGLLVGDGNALQSNFVLLVRRSSGIESFNALGGKKICVDSGNMGALPALWLVQAAKLAGATLGSSGSAPAHLGLAADSFNAIAPVFFGNADACVVTQQGFTENAGLNPQVLHQLHVLAKSPPFITRVIAFPPDVNRAKKSAILARRPTLKGSIQPSGFLGAQEFVLYDVAEGDFAGFKDFDPADLPRIPGSSFPGDPSLTGYSGISADPD